MEVANVVASIISAFGNGMDLFRRMAGKRSKRRGREPTLSEEETWLRESLHHRPLEIQRSYHHNVSRHGHRYEIGDSIAHTSLAHTLLVLNSGLIKLINQALSSDTKKSDISRRSLLSLSEMAAADTLNALSQLSLRLSSQSQLTLQAPPQPTKEKSANDKKVGEGMKLKGGQGERPKKRPGPTPLLVRGGWVRPKSSSVVSTLNSKSRKSGTSKHQRSKSEPVVRKSVNRKQSDSSSKDSKSPTIPEQPESPVARQRSTSIAERPPSMLVVPSDFFLPQVQPPSEHQAAPPRPPKIPLHSRPNPSQLQRPKSSGTMMSASTKIGEIPESRFPSMLQPVEEQVYDPRLVQYLMTTPEGAPPEQPRKRGRGFRFWKKDERQPVAAY